MLFAIRPFRRFPVCFPVTYQAGDFQGEGTVWNISAMGWRFSGNLPLRSGEICSLTVTLPGCTKVYIAAAVVRWLRGEEYGVETLVMDEESQDNLDEYLAERINNEH
jgi:hypothetical protein